jgi:hypothetical protein
METKTKWTPAMLTRIRAWLWNFRWYRRRVTLKRLQEVL